MHTNVDVRLGTLVGGGVGPGEVDGRRPRLALQRNQRALGVSEGKAGCPQERNNCP